MKRTQHILGPGHPRAGLRVGFGSDTEARAQTGGGQGCGLKLGRSLEQARPGVGSRAESRVEGGGKGAGGGASIKGRGLGPNELAARTAKVEPETETRVRRETRRPEPSALLDVSQGPGLGRGRGLGETQGRGLRHGRAGLRAESRFWLGLSLLESCHSPAPSFSDLISGFSSCSKASAASVWLLRRWRHVRSKRDTWRKRREPSFLPLFPISCTPASSLASHAPGA